MDDDDPLALRIYEFIRRVNEREGRGPSRREIAAKLGFPGPESVMPYLRQLSKRGKIRLHPPGAGEDEDDSSA